MNIGKLSSVKTETYHVSFDNEEYQPFPQGSYGRFRALYATLTRTTTPGHEKYSWQIRCHSSYDYMTIFHDSPSTKDIEFPPMRKAFEEVGWTFPENPHNGKPDWY